MNIEDCIKDGFFVTSPFVDRAIVRYPAHPSNYYDLSRGTCKPIALVIHEPQEPSDNYESTPVFFSAANRNASTRWYGDNDGDLYQMVPFPHGAIANGLDRKPMPKFNDGGPEFGAYSLNMQTDNIEVEGYTTNIAQTFTQAQWNGLVDWGVLLHLLWNIPANTGRWLSHKQLSVDRSDGEWIVTKSGAPQEAVRRVLQIEKDIKELKMLAWNQAVKLNEQGGLILGHALKLNKYEAHTTHPPGK